MCYTNLFLCSLLDLPGYLLPNCRLGYTDRLIGFFVYFFLIICGSRLPTRVVSYRMIRIGQV